jgi:ribosome-binding factor A
VGFVTITGVDVTPDLRHATVWASIIGSEVERRATMQVLGRAMPYVRHHLGPLRLKRIPELHLREDDSAERGTRVLQLIEQVGSEAADDGVATGEPVLAPPELPTLPTPRALNEGGVPEGSVEPLPTGYRRRVDRDALRRARRRRGR